MMTDYLMGLVLGFFSGALPFGYWAGRLKGIDIREHGSRNIGATNVIRVLGKKVGIPVFALDLLKGLLPCLVMKVVSMESAVWVLTGMAAVLGHMFTPFLSFKGGKGVATAAGVLLGIAPVAVAVGLGVWLLSMVVFRYVSLASMLAGVGVALTITLGMWRAGSWDGVLLVFGWLLALLVVQRHRSNIGRILAGTESKDWQKKRVVVGEEGYGQ
jgi:glycerol-3-phosphate acyltransferase PlsY